jgi:FixJ family two-component response regulator
MSAAGTPWVFVVDDDLHVLRAFRRLLETAGYNVATYDSPTEFLANHDPALAGCALLDIGMTELSGLDTQEQLHRLGNARPIIFVTGNDDVHTSVMAMKGGAQDYLLKPVPGDALLAAVDVAVRADLEASRERAEIAEFSRNWHGLTTREREVMTHVVRGRLNKQIASDLGIVEKTVKVHRARVMEKMGVRSVAALVHIADLLEAIGLIEKTDANARR